MQGCGSTGRTVHSQTGLDVVAHGKAETAANILAVQPDRLLEQGQLAYALRDQPGRRRQDETRPVVDFEPGAGQQHILRTTADIDTKNRACFLQKRTNIVIHGDSPDKAMAVLAVSWCTG